MSSSTTQSSSSLGTCRRWHVGTSTLDLRWKLKQLSSSDWFRFGYTTERPPQPWYECLLPPSDTYLTITYLKGRDTGETLFTLGPFVDDKNYFNTFNKTAFLLQSGETYRLATFLRASGGGLKRETGLSHELVSKKLRDKLWEEDKWWKYRRHKEWKNRCMILTFR